MNKIIQWFNSSIRNRLTVSFLAVSLIPLVVLGVYSGQALSKTRTQDARDLAAERSRSLAREVEILLLGFSNDVLAISETPPIKGLARARLNPVTLNNETIFFDEEGTSTYEQWQDRLIAIMIAFAANPAYAQLRYLDEAGMELVRVNSEAGKASIVLDVDLQNKADRDYFIETMKLQAGQVYISPLNLNRESGEIEVPYRPVVRYATPVFDAQGNRRGIIILNVNATSFLAPIGDDMDMEMSGQFSMLADAEGYYLAHPEENKLWGFDLGHDARIQKDYPHVGSQLVSGQQAIVENQKNLFAVSPVMYDPSDQTRHWALVTAIPYHEVLAPVREMQRAVLIAAIFSLLAAVIFGLLIANRLTRPLTEITQIISPLKQGDLTVAIPPAGEDEVGQLRGSLRETLQSWKSLIGGLLDDSSNLASSANELASSAEEVSRTSQSQRDQLSRTSSAMEQIATTTLQIALNVDTAAEASESASQKAKQGAQLVEGTASKLAQTEALTAGLLRRAEEITDIVNLIREIAAKTNILALNAAIEAAGAGDAGKRFNVVAEEIRDLASRTRQATVQVNDLVLSVQADIQHSVVMMTEGAQLARGAGDALTGIVDASFALNDLMQVVNGSTGEQNLSIQEVADALESISAGSIQIAGATQQVAQISTELSDLAERLKDSATQFKV